MASLGTSYIFSIALQLQVELGSGVLRCDESRFLLGGGREVGGWIARAPSVEREDVEESDRWWCEDEEEKEEFMATEDARRVGEEARWRRDWVGVTWWG